MTIEKKVRTMLATPVTAIRYFAVWFQRALNRFRLAGGDRKTTADEVLRRQPLLIDEMTYNTSHPCYDAKQVRNVPGRIFNAGEQCDNSAYAALRMLANG